MFVSKCVDKRANPEASGHTFQHKTSLDQCTLFVKNLSFTCTEEDLRGNVTSAPVDHLPKRSSHHSTAWVLCPAEPRSPAASSQQVAACCVHMLTRLQPVSMTPSLQPCLNRLAP